MKPVKLASLFLAGAVGLAACSDDAAQRITANEAESAAFSIDASSPSATTGNHLVVFKKEQVPANFAARVAALGGQVEMVLDELGAATVSGLDSNAISALKKDGAVSIVEPELLLQLELPVGEQELAEAEVAGADLLSPGDPSTASFFPRQWHLRAIDADQAWAAGALGSSAVTVAIIDTGIGYTHPDLVGLVDLERSRSFLLEEDAAVEARFPGAHPIADLHYHGTHVAATVSSNAQAAAGVTSKVTLMGLKVCRSNVPGVTGRGCPSSATFAAIKYAADNGADVINMSLGGNFQKKDFPGYVATINRAFLYANRQGVTMVVSGGNSAIDMDQDGNAYKTYCDTPNTFCVSATGPTARASVNGPWTNIDALASYSNYGRSAIDVAAPGGNGFSRVTAACSPFSLVIPICQTGTFVVGLNGTSMAAPHTSGVAALAVERVGKNPGRVKSLIHQTADDLGQPGTDKFYGKGRINAFNLVSRR